MQPRISSITSISPKNLVIGFFTLLSIIIGYIGYSLTLEKVVVDVKNTTSLFGLVSFNHDLGFDIYTTEGGNYETPNVSAVLITDEQYSEENRQKNLVTFEEIYSAKSRIAEISVGPSNIWGSRLFVSEDELRQYFGTEYIINENYVYFNTPIELSKPESKITTTVCEDSFFDNSASLCAEIIISFQSNDTFSHFKNNTEALKFRDDVVASFKFIRLQ